MRELHEIEITEIKITEVPRGQKVEVY